MRQRCYDGSHVWWNARPDVNHFHMGAPHGSSHWPCMGPKYRLRIQRVVYIYIYIYIYKSSISERFWFNIGQWYLFLLMKLRVLLATAQVLWYMWVDHCKSGDKSSPSESLINSPNCIFWIFDFFVNCTSSQISFSVNSKHKIHWDNRTPRPRGAIKYLNKLKNSMINKNNENN